MHELAICQALIRQVTDLANERSAAAASDIYVALGPLSGVESTLLRNAFPIAAAGTFAQSARLHVEQLPVKVYCPVCDIESTVATNRLLCDQCNGWQTQLVSGDELLLVRLELEPDESVQRHTGNIVEEPVVEG